LRVLTTNRIGALAFCLCVWQGMFPSAASAEELVLRAGAGLKLTHQIGRKEAIVPVKPVMLVRDAGDQGLADSQPLRIEIDGLNVIEPAAKIERAVLRKSGKPVALAPPRQGEAPFAPLGIWIETKQKRGHNQKPPEPMVVMEGQGEVTCDLTDLIQRQVYTDPNKSVAILLNIAHDAAGAQFVAPDSIELEIEYGSVEARHRVSPPSRIRVEPQQDRTFGFHWKPGGAQDPLKKVKYWYEFELFVTDEQYAAQRSVYDRLTHTFEQWDADKQAQAAMEEIQQIDDEPVAFTFMEAEDDLQKAVDKEVKRSGPPADVETVGDTWQEAWQKHPCPPPEPDAFEVEKGQWLPLNVRYFVPWNNHQIEAEKPFARVNLGEDMPREELPYRFRVRVVASNGQQSDWVETDPVTHHNPGYLAWASHVCYKARQRMGPAGRKSYPFGDAFAMNYDNMPLGVSIAAAKDEYEPFQVLFKHEFDESAEVALELSPLEGENGRIETWAMTPYRWVFLAAPAVISGGSSMDIRVPAMPPDVLANVYVPFEDPYSHHPLRRDVRYPANPYTALPSEPVGFFIDLKVPGSAKAGIYKGKATLVINGETRIDVPVELEVFDFFMPRRRTVATTFGDAGPGKNRAGDYDRWVKMMHQHRANGYGARVRPEVEVYDPSRETWGDETYAGADWSLYKRIIAPYADGYMFEDGVPMRKFGLTGWYAACSQIAEEVGFAGYTGLGKVADDVRWKLMGDYLRDLRLNAMRLGIADRLWYYEVDEPGTDSPNPLCTIDSMFFHMKRYFPEMLCMVTSLKGNTHIGLITAYNTNPTTLMVSRDFGKARQALGEEWWLYNAFTSTADVNAHMNQRFVPWYAWRQKADCWLQWITNYGVSWDLWPEYGGDGDMTYRALAGHFGIRDLMWVGNMEMKLYREGMEDIEYLEMASKAIGIEGVNEIVKRVSYSACQHTDPAWHPYNGFKSIGRFRNRGGMNYNAVPSILFEVRRELARVIVENQVTDGQPTGTVKDLLAEANGLMEKDDGRAAMPLIKRALQLDPAHWDAGKAEIACYQALDMPEEAKDSAVRLMRRHRQDPAAWKVLGDVYAAMSRFEDAQDCWNKALERNPDAGLRREIETAVAGSSIEGAEVLRLKLRPDFLAKWGETMFYTGLQDWTRWPSSGDRAGNNIWRGAGQWGGFKTVPHTRAGLTSKLAALDIAGLPRNAKVKRAWIECRMRNAEQALATSGSFYGYTAYAVLKPWFPQHLTMRQYDKGKDWDLLGCGQPGVDRGPLYSPGGMSEFDWDTGTLRLDITRIVRDWVDGKYPNHGIAVIPQGSPIESDKATLYVYYTTEQESVL
jgi:tetratricopeptide (TPR) repeat protein